MSASTTGPVFSHAHILITAAITTAITLGWAIWRLGRIVAGGVGGVVALHEYG